MAKDNKNESIWEKAFNTVFGEEEKKTSPEKSGTAQKFNDTSKELRNKYEDKPKPTNAKDFAQTANAVKNKFKETEPKITNADKKIEQDPLKKVTAQEYSNTANELKQEAKKKQNIFSKAFGAIKNRFAGKKNEPEPQPTVTAQQFSATASKVLEQKKSQAVSPSLANAAKNIGQNVNKENVTAAKYANTASKVKEKFQPKNKGKGGFSQGF